MATRGGARPSPDEETPRRVPGIPRSASTRTGPVSPGPADGTGPADSAGSADEAGPAGDDGWVARERLALIAEQRRTMARGLGANQVPVLVAWGVAWLAGFGAIYLTSGRLQVMPDWAAGVILGVGFAIALTLSAVLPIRRRRGLTGPTRQVSVLYGWSWALGLAGLFAVNLGLDHHGLPLSVRPLVWSGSALLVVGLLYLASGLIWSDRVQYGLGAWTLITGAGSVAAGTPANFAVLSLAGGGGFLLAAAVSLTARRSRTGDTR
jgi:hypothetical protein